MSSESIQDRIQREAQRAVIQNAFFRWESALVIGGAVLLSVFLPQPFPGWPWWAWPLLGLLGEIAIVVSSLTDKAETQKVIESLFRTKYDIGAIHDRDLRAKLNEADEYRQRIQQVVAQQRSGVLRDRLVETTSQVYDWIANMVELARRIETYRMDEIIQRDKVNLPKEIKELTARMALESSPRVREQMATTLGSKQQFAGNLEELSGRMERADLQLEHSLAALGTVYSQLLLIGSQDVDSDRAERIRGDIRGEVAALQDLVVSLNEVYNVDPAGPRTTTATDPLRHQQSDRAAG
jgi:hypothetical protein